MPPPDGLWWGRKTDLSPEREVAEGALRQSAQDGAVQDREGAFGRLRHPWLGSDRTAPKAQALLAQQEQLHDSCWSVYGCEELCRVLGRAELGHHK